MSSFVINPYAFGVAEDADAAAYLNAVEVEDGQALEAGVRKAVDDFVKGCKNDGIWSDIKTACILAGARTLDGALVPLVGSAPTSTGFVSGDYDRENGLVGGSGRNLNSNRSNADDPQNDFHMSVYVHTVGSAAFGYYIATTGTSTGADNILRNNATSLFWRCRSNQSDSPANSNVTGLIGSNRASSSNYDAYYGGSTTTYSRTSQTPNGNDIFVFNNTSSAGIPSNGRLQWYSIGEATDLALLEGRLDTLMADFATAIV
jgi:hypothetical protein